MPPNRLRTTDGVELPGDSGALLQPTTCSFRSQGLHQEQGGRTLPSSEECSGFRRGKALCCDLHVPQDEGDGSAPSSRP